jgi:hypothetical protein
VLTFWLAPLVRAGKSSHPPQNSRLRRFGELSDFSVAPQKNHFLRKAALAREEIRTSSCPDVMTSRIAEL